MQPPAPLTLEESQLFAEAVRGTKKLNQDTIRFAPPPVKQKQALRIEREDRGSSFTFSDFHFSDEYQPHLEQEGAVRYVRSDVSKYELKKLRRGDYAPEVLLDLHGMTQQQAKQELAALLAYCRREQILVASVMHGIGKHILKEKLPVWLAQHPDVRAFHQASREWGGNSALLVLLETEE